MTAITQRDPDTTMIGFSALAIAGFVLAAILWGARPDPLAGRVVACASSIALLGAAIRVPYPGLARTFMRAYAAVAAAVFAIASIAGG